MRYVCHNCATGQSVSDSSLEGTAEARTLLPRRHCGFSLTETATLERMHIPCHRFCEGYASQIIRNHVMLSQSTPFRGPIRLSPSCQRSVWARHWCPKIRHMRAAKISGWAPAYRLQRVKLHEHDGCWHRRNPRHTEQVNRILGLSITMISGLSAPQGVLTSDTGWSPNRCQSMSLPPASSGRRVLIDDLVRF